MSKPTVLEFRTVADMHAIPIEKLPAFCEDLRLWLSLARMGDANGFALDAPEVFGWIDDNRHDVKINVRIESPVVPPSKKGKKSVPQAKTAKKGATR